MRLEIESRKHKRTLDRTENLIFVLICTKLVLDQNSAYYFQTSKLYQLFVSTQLGPGYRYAY